MPSIFFRVARTAFRIQSLNGRAILSLPLAWNPFVIPTSPFFDATYLVEQEPDGQPRPPTHWGNDLWRIGQDAQEQWVLELAHPETHHWRMGAKVSPDFSAGTLYHARTAQPPYDPIPYPLEQPLIIARLAFLSGMVLHASCVMIHGRGVLFVGQSGRGKTTLARLCRSHGATILNDERNIIRTLNNTLQVSSSPWHGEENEVHPDCVPLAAVCFIRHATQNSLTPLHPSAAAALLLQHAFIPVFLPQGMELLADLAGNVLQQVPAYDCAFTPDERAPRMIMRVLKERS